MSGVAMGVTGNRVKQRSQRRFTMNVRGMMRAAIGVLICVWGGEANAGDCRAEAEFIHSYPANKDNSKFKFKFRVSSDDCVLYSCSGYVHYRIHFEWASGGSSSKSTLVRYYIPSGQRFTEVTDETFPTSVSNSNTIIRDVEVKEVSCS